MAALSFKYLNDLQQFKPNYINILADYTTPYRWIRQRLCAGFAAECVSSQNYKTKQLKIGKSSWFFGVKKCTSSLQKTNSVF